MKDEKIQATKNANGKHPSGIVEWLILIFGLSVPSFLIIYEKPSHIQVVIIILISIYAVLLLIYPKIIIFPRNNIILRLLGYLSRILGIIGILLVIYLVIYPNSDLERKIMLNFPVTNQSGVAGSGIAYRILIPSIFHIGERSIISIKLTNNNSFFVELKAEIDLPCPFIKGFSVDEQNAMGWNQIKWNCSGVATLESKVMELSPSSDYLLSLPVYPLIAGDYSGSYCVVLTAKQKGAIIPFLYWQDVKYISDYCGQIISICIP